MNLVVALHGLENALAAAAVTAMWQGALIAGALALCLRCVPRVPAAHRFAVWSAVFLLLIALPFMPLVPSGSTGVVASGVSAATAAAGPRLNVDARWSFLVLGLWVVVSVVRAGDLVLHLFRLRKLWKDAQPLELSEKLSSVLGDAAAASGRGPVEVCTTASLQRPSVIGFFRPRILIPDWLFARLTEGEVQQIVLHEAEHLRRRDDWTNLLQKVCLVIFPLNPALVWIERRLCREREMACDDGVIRITRAPRSYAACLASMAERGLERRAEALSLGAWQRRSELVHRVHSILRNKRRLSPMGTRVVLGALGCGLAFASVALARCPQLVAFVPEHIAAPAQATNVPRQVAVVRAVAAKSAARVVRTRVAVAANSAENDRGMMQDATLRWKTPATTPALHEARPALLKAEMQQAAVQMQEPEEQLIVFTAWVEPMNVDAQVKADYDVPANADANTQAATSSASRLTVTRLIFRVLPANAAQPGVTAVRDGWFVIQL